MKTMAFVLLLLVAGFSMAADLTEIKPAGAESQVTGVVDGIDPAGMSISIRFTQQEKEETRTFFYTDSTRFSYKSKQVTPSEISIGDVVAIESDSAGKVLRVFVEKHQK